MIYHQKLLVPLKKGRKKVTYLKVFEYKSTVPFHQLVAIKYIITDNKNVHLLLS